MLAKAIVCLLLCLEFRICTSIHQKFHNTIPVLRKSTVVSGILAIALSHGMRPAVGDTTNGRVVFDNNCSSCHLGGGNILDSSKDLTKKALIKNKEFDTSDMISLVSNGKGRMPAYAAFISPVGNPIKAKLTDQEIANVVEYVREKSDLSWPKSESRQSESRNCDEYPGC